MSELPAGWVRIPISQACTMVRGVTYNKTESSDEPLLEYLPVLRANNIQTGKLVFSDLVYVPKKCIAPHQLIKAGDVVVAMSSGSKSVVGKAAKAVSDWEGAFGAFCGVLRPSSEVNHRYFYFFTQSAEYRTRVSELSAGVNINNLKPAHFEMIEIAVAPLAEQTRIAAKLDELLAQVDTLKARIDGIPALLKRFRQSVLAAAVCGRLTEGRNSGAPMTVCALGEVCEFRNGFAYKSGDYKNTGIPLVRISDIDGKNASPSSDVFVDECLYETRFSISKGDLLIAMSGATTGKVGIYQSETLALQNQRVGNILVKTDGRIIPAYRNIVVFQMSGDIIKSAYGGAQPNISAKEICSMLINLPEVEEQTEIVRRVEQLFAFADQLEARVKAAQARIDRLTQSILAKAFRGELVPQDPNDEPASVLLERIKAQRAAEPKAKRGRKASA
ncbi:restriction endonuclease subunit S [Pseudomonas sp.]|uniref:restriction endonuclease subunit S n=1 Tax=Pseudomonas sp. TaxID=306 RepID=UPI003D11F9E8